MSEWAPSARTNCRGEADSGAGLALIPAHPRPHLPKSPVPGLTQDTTRPLKQGSRALSSEISSFTTLQGEQGVGHGSPQAAGTRSPLSVWGGPHHTPYSCPLGLPSSRPARASPLATPIAQPHVARSQLGREGEGETRQH